MLLEEGMIYHYEGKLYTDRKGSNVLLGEGCDVPLGELVMCC